MTIIDSREALEALPAGAVIRQATPDDGCRPLLMERIGNYWDAAGGMFYTMTQVAYGIEHHGDRYVRLYDTNPADAWDEGRSAGFFEPWDDSPTNPYREEDGHA